MERFLIAALCSIFAAIPTMAHADDLATVTILFTDAEGDPIDMSWEEEVEWLDLFWQSRYDPCHEVSRTFLRYGEEVPWLGETRTEEFYRRRCMPRDIIVMGTSAHEITIPDFVFLHKESSTRAVARVKRGTELHIIPKFQVQGWSKTADGRYVARLFQPKEPHRQMLKVTDDTTVQVVFTELLTVPTEVYLPLTGRFVLTSGANETIFLESGTLTVPDGTWTLGWSPTALGHDVREPEPPENAIVLADDKVVKLGESIVFKPGDTFLRSITVRKPRKTLEGPLPPRRDDDDVCWPSYPHSWRDAGYRLVGVDGRCVIQWWENPPEDKPYLAKGPRESEPFDHIHFVDFERGDSWTWGGEDPPAAVPYYIGVMGAIQSFWPTVNSRATYFRGNEAISETHAAINVSSELPRNATVFIGLDIEQGKDGTWQDRIWVYAQGRRWGPYRSARHPTIGSDGKAVFPAQLIEDGLWHMVWGDDVGDVGFADGLEVQLAGRAAENGLPAESPSFRVICSNTTVTMSWNDQHPCGSDVLPDDDPELNLDDLNDRPLVKSRRTRRR